jgi:hypothetical protein
VQGHLRNEAIEFTVESECAHCQRAIELEIDSDLHYRVLTKGAEPLVHVPMVDVTKLDAPNIIDGF